MLKKSYNATVFILVFVFILSIESYADSMEDYFSRFSGNRIKKAEIVINDYDELDQDALAIEDRAIEKFIIEEEWDESMKLFKSALKIEQRLVYAPILMAQYYRAVEKNYKKAEKLLKDAIKFHPDIAQFYIELGETCWVFGDIEKSMKYTLTGLEKGFPKQEGVYYNLALSSYSLEKLDDCINYCKQGISYDPASERCKKLMIVSYLDLNQSANALFSSGDSLCYYTTAANYYMDHRKEESAAFIIEKAMELYPGDEEILSCKSRLLYIENDLEGALEIIESLQVDDPYNYFLYNTKGAVLVTMEKYEEAIEMYKSALEKYPDDSDILSKMASLYLIVYHYRAARAIYSRLLEKHPGDIDLERKINYIDSVIH